MKKIFYIMGKSATGKDKIYRMLTGEEAGQLRLCPLLLYTTRPIRMGETEGVQYHFVDEEILAALEKENKVIEMRDYDTVCGKWYYFTADDGQIDLTTDDYIGIGTLESYKKMKEYFGAAHLIPIYIETEDGIRLGRALEREKKQSTPRYAEMCRRFLADCADFDEEKIVRAGITRRFENNTTLEACFEEIKAYIQSVQAL